MDILEKKKRKRKRNCYHCNELYLPDNRNAYHQKYCSKPHCRRASKKASQSKWLSSEKGAGYFTGAKNVEHVQRWRKLHPGYSRKKVLSNTKTLQDDCFSQRDLNQSDRDILKKHALQELYSSQLPLLLGVIANLTGNTLQDDIVRSSQKFVNLGNDILGTLQCNSVKSGST